MKLLVAASVVREVVQLLAGDVSGERSMLLHNPYIFYIPALSHRTERISKVRRVKDARSTQKEGSRWISHQWTRRSHRIPEPPFWDSPDRSSNPSSSGSSELRNFDVNSSRSHLEGQRQHHVMIFTPSTPT
jgi:hypothetical protein